MRLPLIVKVGLIVVVIVGDVILSIWWLAPVWRNRILAEYYIRRYPHIPKSEFLYQFRPYGKTYVSGLQFFPEGINIRVKNLDGSTTQTTQGFVTPLSAREWSDHLGIAEDNFMFLTDRDFAINHELGKVAISRSDQRGIIDVPKDATIVKPAWKIAKGKMEGNFGSYQEIAMEDIVIGDYIEMHIETNGKVKVTVSTISDI